MAKITKVPNGPLIKKKGPFKGSTLKTGGTIKKAQNGDTLTVKKPMTYAEKRTAQQLVKEKNIRARDSILNRNAAARGMTREEVRAQQEKDKKKPDACVDGLRGVGKDNEGCSGSAGASARRVKREARRKNGGPVKKLQNGGGGKAKKEYVNRMNTADSLMSASDRQIKDGNYLNMISNKPDWNRPLLRIGRENREKAEKLKKKKPLGPTRFKAGGMIKRADGSMSRRGLWDNIRANKGSGKKPTKQMLVQEKKIKAKSKK